MNMQSRRFIIQALLLVALEFFFLTSCTTLKPFPGGPTVQTGVASWYGADFQGKRTSNREIYNMYDMTAAHRTLPFGTRVMVTNLTNGRATVVRINDRGPFVGDRLIDLSYGAASLLDMIGCGIAPVRIEVLKGQQPPNLVAPKYSVQVGAFIYEENALQVEKALKKSFKDVYVTPYETRWQVYYRVRIKASDLAGSERIARKLCDIGYRALVLEEQ
jgi:rare lipoprotein A